MMETHANHQRVQVVPLGPYAAGVSSPTISTCPSYRYHRRTHLATYLGIKRRASTSVYSQNDVPNVTIYGRHPCSSYGLAISNCTGVIRHEDGGVLLTHSSSKAFKFSDLGPVLTQLRLFTEI